MPNCFLEGFSCLTLSNPGFLSGFNLWLSFEWLSESPNGALTFSIGLLGDYFIVIVSNFIISEWSTHSVN